MISIVATSSAVALLSDMFFTAIAYLIGKKSNRNRYRSKRSSHSFWYYWLK